MLLQKVRIRYRWFKLLGAFNGLTSYIDVNTPWFEFPRKDRPVVLSEGFDPYSFFVSCSPFNLLIDQAPSCSMHIAPLTWGLPYVYNRRVTILSGSGEPSFLRLSVSLKLCGLYNKADLVVYGRCLQFCPIHS